MARVPLVGLDDVPTDKRHMFAPKNPFADPDHVADLATPEWEERLLHIHRAMGHNLPVFHLFRHFSGSLETGLTPAQRELAILAIARELDCEYVWHQHAGPAHEAGVPEETVLAVGEGDLGSLPEADGALATYAAAFAGRSVDDATHAALLGHFDEADLVGLVTLGGFYVGVAHIVDAFELATEGPFVGWDLAGASGTAED